MPIFLLSIIFAFLLGCGFTEPIEQNRCGFLPSPTYYRIRHTSLPVIVDFDHNFKEGKEEFKQAVALWNEAWQAGGNNGPLVAFGESDNLIKYGDLHNIKKSATTEHLYNDYGVIARSFLIFNINSFYGFSYSRHNNNKVDFISLAVHEIGHLLGLGHTEDKRDIMYKILDEGVLKRQPSKKNIEQIKCGYNRVL